MKINRTDQLNILTDSFKKDKILQQQKFTTNRCDGIRSNCRSRMPTQLTTRKSSLFGNHVDSNLASGRKSLFDCFSTQDNEKVDITSHVITNIYLYANSFETLL